MTDAAVPGALTRPPGGTLSIANIPVALDEPLCLDVRRWPASYQPFLLTPESSVAAARFVLGEENDHPAESRFTPTYIAGSWRIGVVDGRTTLRFHTGDDRAYLWASPEPDYGQVTVWPEREDGRKMPPLLHPVDRVLFMGVLAHREGFIVHSCAWSCGGKSLLFPGVSGAGKTTICRQLMAAGQGNILSDDRVIVRNSPEGFRAHGTPWPGDAKQARNESAPLAGLCFIEKTSEHRLIPIGPAEAFRRLLEAAAIPWYDTALRDRVLPLAERLVETVPAYRLGFHPSPGVADVLHPLLATSG